MRPGEGGPIPHSDEQTHQTPSALHHCSGTEVSPQLALHRIQENLERCIQLCHPYSESLSSLKPPPHRNTRALRFLPFLVYYYC